MAQRRVDERHRVGWASVVLAISLLVLVGCSSGDDERADVGKRGRDATVAPTTTVRGDTNVVESDSSSSDTSAPPNADAEPPPELTPLPSGPSAGPTAGKEAPIPEAGLRLDAGLVASLVGQGYSEQQAGCIADAVLARFRAEALTEATRYLTDPANEQAPTVGPELIALVDECRA